jgi:hypothetical protein
VAALGGGGEKNSTKVQKMLTSQIFAVMFLVTSTSSETQKFVKLTFFAPWLNFFHHPPQELPHTTLDIPTKFHEV